MHRFIAFLIVLCWHLEGRLNDCRLNYLSLCLGSPGDNSLYIDSLPAGQIFIDPAAHLAGRHGTPYVETAFVAASKTGFSKAWCFNPYLGIDIRGTGEVCPE